MKSQLRTALEERLSGGPATVDELMPIALATVHPSQAVRRRRNHMLIQRSGEEQFAKPLSPEMELMVGTRLILIGMLHSAKRSGILAKNELGQWMMVEDGAA